MRVITLHVGIFHYNFNHTIITKDKKCWFNMQMHITCYPWNMPVKGGLWKNQVIFNGQGFLTLIDNEVNIKSNINNNIVYSV